MAALGLGHRRCQGEAGFVCWGTPGCCAGGSGWPSQVTVFNCWNSCGDKGKGEGWDLAQICYKLGLQLDLRKI